MFKQRINAQKTLNCLDEEYRQKIKVAPADL